MFQNTYAKGVISPNISQHDPSKISIVYPEKFPDSGDPPKSPARPVPIQTQTGD